MNRALFALVALVATLPASPTFAGWNPDGVTIKNTTMRVPRVAACGDGNSGAYVTWQEELSEAQAGVGPLRVQHVLATGDVDPAWPADGVIACTVNAVRSALGAVADGQGGLYLWWMEGNALFAKRVLPGGQTATGWAERGSVVGNMAPNRRPTVLSDGGTGIYFAWSNLAAVVKHLGPDNTGPVRTVRPPTGMSLDLWPQIALADDAGVFVAFANQSTDPEVPSVWVLSRLLPDLQTAPGWPAAGIDVEPTNLEGIVNANFGQYPAGSMVALAPDGAGGVFMWTEDDAGGLTMEWRLRRLQGDGSPAQGWVAEGVTIEMGQWSGEGTWPNHPHLSLRAAPGGVGEVFIGAILNPLHSRGVMTFRHYTQQGPGPPIWASWVGGSVWGAMAPELDVLVHSSGSVFFSSCVAWGDYQEYDPYAEIHVLQRPMPVSWNDWSITQWQTETSAEWYGDVALAEGGPGGVIFFWSQRRQQFGLFARRFGLTGQVTGVDEPGVVGVALGAPRPNPGRSGAEASIPIALERGAEVSLSLVDVAGREVARRAPERLEAGAHTIRWDPGAVANGIYFVRMVSGGTTASRRWVVLR